MKWSKRLTRSPIGIDLGAGWIKAAQLIRHSHGQWQLAAAAATRREQPDQPPTDQQIDHLIALLQRQGLTGRQVVLAAPPETMHMDMLTLPPRSSGAPIDEIAHMELARMHKLEPAAVQTDLWDLPQPARGREAAYVMVAGCEHDRAHELLAPFERHGLDVTGLDCHAWAVLRACRALLAPAPEITTILDVGWSAASLVVVHEQTVVYERLLDNGGTQHLHQILARHLNLSDEAIDHALGDMATRTPTDDQENPNPLMAELRGMVAAHFLGLAEQLQAAFAYVTHQYPQTHVARLLLVGGGAAACHLDEQLSETLGTTVQTVRPSDIVTVDSPAMLPQPQTALASAIGLAMYDQ